MEMPKPPATPVARLVKRIGQYSITCDGFRFYLLSPSGRELESYADQSEAEGHALRIVAGPR